MKPSPWRKAEGPFTQAMPRLIACNLSDLCVGGPEWTRVTYLCETCRAVLEKRTVHLEGSSASRFFCPQCKASYTQQQVCDVCHLGRTSVVLGTVVFRSSILGEHHVRHCPTCHPPSKFSLEFTAGPGHDADEIRADVWGASTVFAPHGYRDTLGFALSVVARQNSGKELIQ